MQYCYLQQQKVREISIKVDLNSKMTTKAFDFVTAMNIIAAVEKSPYKGDMETLKLALGKETFKTMAAAGYLSGGFTFHEEKIIDTYATTRNYRAWKDLIDNIE